ncbi:transposase [Halococcus saccharolyticus]|uniref:transposase n=1 Tax=Halococcus saccharolyticus TaxID=62319 RepID=UPI000A740BBB|nr:transposase [Halococcus saccharolyticus]
MTGVDLGDRWECPSCGTLSVDSYRCSECGRDLASEGGGKVTHFQVRPEGGA